MSELNKDEDDNHDHGRAAHDEVQMDQQKLLEESYDKNKQMNDVLSTTA